MRLSAILAAGAALFLSSHVGAINILMSNDDGFGSANLREMYRMLKDEGHNVWVVAPALPQSGQGGRSFFAEQANLTGPAQYNLIPAGAPSVGSDPIDSQIWYYNGTPAACVFVALDYVLPRFADFSVPDLVVTGPNYGTNLGPFVWTLSGTAGAAYAATHRSIPALAFSASNRAISYLDIVNETNPATWAAKVSTKIARTFIDSAPPGSPILPLGYGANINIPVLTANFTDPKIIQTRFTGNAHVNEAVLDPADGTFDWANIKPYAAGVNTCINGDCSMPGETYIVEHGKVAISLYTIDYTAPTTSYTKGIMERLAPIASTC